MKQITLYLLAAVLTVCGFTNATAQDGEGVTPYFTTEEMPDLIKCLPAPPDTTSINYYYDIMQYMWGKEQRLDPEREAIARRDAVWSFDNLFAEFDIPFGLTISRTETPEIWKLLETSLVTTDQMRVAPKNFYMRRSPFLRFHEHILTYQAEEDEEKLKKSGSYPSGHTTRGWITALLLSEIAPSKADTILARGYMYGDSRVIVGAHWQTDVEVSRLGAVIGYMRLQTSPAFQEQMKKAQAEYTEKTGVAIVPSAADNIERDSCDYYYLRSEMPNMMKFLPAPPDTIGNKFARDIMRYMWGKTMRQDAERADMAKRDAVYGVDCIIREFSEAFGLTITKEGTPEIYKVLLDGCSTCDSICYEPKKFYMRRRPFMRMEEPTLTPEDEESLRKNGSYPSGHTLLGWSSALLLSEINPANADKLMTRGYMYGDSRLIVGAHWQSDVDAGRLAASAAYAKIHNSARFREQMKKAQQEFAEKTGQTVGIRTAAPAAADGSARAYRLDGTPATESTRGIVIQNNQKTVRK
ncbi:MAG: phosphatase PAP2 family protein [Prevotella sp.]|nr:phosphatase PAP2 family protein [Prevotella sp.]